VHFHFWELDEINPYGCKWDWLIGPEQIPSHIVAKDDEALQRMKTSYRIANYWEDIKVFIFYCVRIIDGLVES
jgi:hypothetical protein